MRLLTFQHEGLVRLGVQLGEYVLDLPAAAVEMDVPDLAFCEDMLSLLDAGDAGIQAASALVTETWRQIDARQLDKLADRGILRRLNGVKLTAPIRPSKIVAIGLNYRDHAREQDSPIPEQPIVFAKFPTSVVGPGDAIVWDPALTQQVDYEAELAVVIGKRARKVSEEGALEYVAGYTCANDVSARDLQFGDRQWVRGKSLDTFCPLGPVIVTPDEIADPQNLSIRAILNGETMQDSRTSEMIFDVRALIAFASRAFTLLPGDVILTGTPHGVGVFRKPPVFLKDGDAIAVEIEKMGRLENVCRTA